MNKEEDSLDVYFFFRKKETLQHHYYFNLNFSFMDIGVKMIANAVLSILKEL